MCLISSTSTVNTGRNVTVALFGVGGGGCCASIVKERRCSSWILIRICLIMSISKVVSISWSIGCWEWDTSGVVDEGREDNTEVGKKKGVTGFHCWLLRCVSGGTHMPVSSISSNWITLNVTFHWGKDYGKRSWQAIAFWLGSRFNQNRAIQSWILSFYYRIKEKIYYSFPEKGFCIRLSSR